MAKTLTREQIESIFSSGILVRDSREMKSEALRRKRPDHRISVPHRDVGEYDAKGWAVEKALKTRTRLTKPKTGSELMEDEVWSLLLRAGFTEMNGPYLTLPYQSTDGKIKKKQIDVYAKDEETVIVCECKTRQERGRRSLQKDIHEICSFKSEMAAAINTYYGDRKKPKIVWLIATRNIIWSESDLDRAKADNIKVITENELSYYNAFIQHMGPAGRFQLLAEFLQGQKIPGLANTRVPAVKGKIGGYTYYSFVASPRQLLPISFVNHLALNHPDGKPAYQRMVKKSRLKKIGAFIDKGGYFPTNILVNLTQKCRFDQIANNDGGAESTKYGWLYLPEKYKSAWVIDGQHRLYGFSFADEASWDASIFVLAFEHMETADEADLFITINHEQKSVPKSVIDALQSDLKWGSDIPKDRLSALHSALVKQINSDPTSPLFQRFVVEGVAPSDTRCITIPEMMNGLRRANVIGKVVNNVLAPGPLSASTDEQTLKRARKVINSYFDIMAEANPARWNAGRKGLVATNSGVRAHLQLLAEMIRQIEVREDTEAVNERADYLIEQVTEFASPVKKYLAEASEDEMRESFGRKLGEAGVREYFFNLCEVVSRQSTDFGPPNFKTFIEQKYDSRRKQAHQDVIHITEVMMDVLRRGLIELYGDHRLNSGDEAYWEFGISDKNIKHRAYQKQIDDATERKMPKVAYLDVLDIKKIVRQTENWEYFEPLFNVPLPGEKGKKYYLDWMDKFNELRRVPAHASGLRVYTEEDYQLLEWIKARFLERVEDRGQSLT